MVRQKVPESISKGFDFPLYENLGKDDTIKIEILIGLDCYWSLIKDMKQLDTGLTAQCTSFGWMVSGSYKNPTFCPTKDTTATLFCWGREPTEATVRSCWELDAIGIKSSDSLDNSSDFAILEKFNESISFDNGRYQVRLPWKSEEHKGMVPLQS